MNWKRFNIKEIDWTKVATAVKETLVSIGQGSFLLRLRVDKLFPYILVLFILGGANIWLSYVVEQTALKVEKNKKVMEYYRNDYANKTYEFVKAGKISNVKVMLEKAGSKVTTPEKPAVIIKTK